MESFEFDEKQLGNLDEIAKILFENENDPTSNLYKRNLVRPKISWFKLALWVLLPIVFMIITHYFFRSERIKNIYFLPICLSSLLIYFAVTARWFAICAVKIYQRFAPEKVRMQCRFEPSCSEYMIQAITKYGFFKGVKLGLNRVNRCNVDGGGYDYP